MSYHADRRTYTETCSTTVGYGTTHRLEQEYGTSPQAGGPGPILGLGDP